MFLIDVINALIFKFLYVFSGLGQDDSEYIDIMSAGVHVKDFLRQAFGRAGFAKYAHHRDKLLPCPVGTFVNPSARDPNDLKCLECPAG